MVLHAIAVLAVLSYLFDFDVSHQWFVVATAIAAACELTAFALRPRQTASPLDAMEVGVRFACGAVFGAFTVPLTAWIRGWTDSAVGLGLLALAGAAVCGSLAVRFGQEFWGWVQGPRNPF